MFGCMCARVGVIANCTQIPRGQHYRLRKLYRDQLLLQAAKSPATTGFGQMLFCKDACPPAAWCETQCWKAAEAEGPMSNALE